MFVSHHFQGEVRSYVHDYSTAGHVGVFRNYERLRRRYFSPKLYSFVYKHLIPPGACQRSNYPTFVPPDLLQPLSPPDRVFERLEIDFFGSFRISTRNNRYVGFAIDHWTRYVVTAPLRIGASAEITILFLFTKSC